MDALATFLMVRDRQAKIGLPLVGLPLCLRLAFLLVIRAPCGCDSMPFLYFFDFM